MNLRMWISRASSTAHVSWHFLKNFLLLPYYAFRDRGFLHQQMRAFVANVINFEKEYQTRVERVNWTGLQKLVGGTDPSLRFRTGARYGNVSFEESLVLAYLAESLRPRQIFEIGTFDGFSTYHLAMNGAEDAKVYTLTLPVDGEGPAAQLARGVDSEYFGDNKTHQELKRRGVGSIYRACPAAGKVHQLFGDSLTFDFAPYRGVVDLVFIDGGHSLECITKDTENALAMLSDRGVIVWHDFNVQHRDVFRFLREFAKTRKTYWIAGTRLALFGPGLTRRLKSLMN
jgi:predicted O-methyltransferase YrrM